MMSLAERIQSKMRAQLESGRERMALVVIERNKLASVGADTTKLDEQIAEMEALISKINDVYGLII